MNEYWIVRVQDGATLARKHGQRWLCCERGVGAYGVPVVPVRPISSDECRAWMTGEGELTVGGKAALLKALGGTDES